jgi:hypothetical protein
MSRLIYKSLITHYTCISFCQSISPLAPEQSAQCTLHKMNFLGWLWLKLSFGTKQLKITEWNFYVGKLLNCIQRQLIQSKQSKPERCFSWTYRQVTTQKWEIYFGPDTVFNKRNQHFWSTRLQTKYVPHTKCSKLNFITQHLICDKVMGWRVWGSNFGMGNPVSRPTLGPTQPPIQWVAQVLSWGKGEQLVHEFNHAPLPSANIKDMWSYTSTLLIRLHGTD